jgi:hypothetical protein
MIGSPHILSVNDCTRGIQAVSAQLMGDATYWMTIIELNQLTPPYLTINPVDAYGLPTDTEVLQSNANSGSNTLSIDIASPQLWENGNPIVISTTTAAGIQLEANTIYSVSGTTVTLVSNLEYSYLAGSSVNVYAVAPIVQSKVLLPADILYLPIESGSAVISSQGQLSNTLGSDMQSPVSITNGDFSVVSGMTTLKQRIANAILTQLGSLPYYTEFGSKINELVGAPITSNTQWQATVRQALMALPEIYNVTGLSLVTNSTGVSSLTAKVWINGSSAPILLYNEPLTTNFLT